MKLSVVIAFHQYSNYLKECFHSLSDSSFIDFECVVVLDHVSEDIEALLSEYKKKLSIQVYTLDVGCGVSAARNLGMSKSQGDYIYFLDADDYVLEDTLSTLMSVDGGDVLCGECAHTWNNKVNFLAKRVKKEADILASERLEKESRTQERYDAFMALNAGSYAQDRLNAVYYLFKKRRGFKEVSVLGNAYKRSFLEQAAIRFDESFTYYSDIPFLMQVLVCVHTFTYAPQAEYIKRKHNDPINQPALQQREDEGRFTERMRAFTRARDILSDDGLMRYLLDRKIITYYLYNYCTRLRRSEKPEWRGAYFLQFSEVLQGTRSDVLKNLKGWQRRLVVAIQRKELKAVLKKVRLRLAKKKIKTLFKNKNVFYKLAYYHIFLKRPLLDNVVVFESFNAKNYSDSPKYIYEYLAAHYGDAFTCVWAINKKGVSLPYPGKRVRRFSFRYAYYLARSKYLVFNVRQPLWFRKREGQVFLQTWHGTPLKRLVFDQTEVTAASPKYKQEFYKQRSDWDYLVSANDFSTATLSRCFMYEGEMLAYGYPRNDILYAADKEDKAQRIRTSLHIPLDKKTVLYAPTWRDDEYYGKGQYKFTLQLDLAQLQQRIGNEYVVLLRTHQYIADAIDTRGLEGFAYNVSSYDDISELYLISDICITDYSSVFFDYANLKRPILFYTYDIEKYKNQLRGFYIDMNTELPGPLLYTNEEVIEAIENIDEVSAEYEVRYAQFYERFCHLDDGNASQKIVEKVFLQS